MQKKKGYRDNEKMKSLDKGVLIQVLTSNLIGVITAPILYMHD
jgi:hypothetical protein